MEAPKDRLREAMERKGYKSPTEFATAHRKLNRNTVTSHLNGNRPISKGAAKTYADLLGVKPGWILFEEEDAPQDLDVPVISKVAAGNLRFQQGIEPHDIERHIKVGSLPRGDWIALVVEGDSMDRIAPDGAIILIDRADDRLIDGKYYVFALGGGEATFKRFRREPRRLQPFSTNPDHMSITAEDDDLYVVGRAKRVIQDI